ncbi:MAG: hypothetical protein EB150_04065 [Nitrososphaeria archaeon]|nr:hypothetical protein [Nitrososphaeria archaeon]NDB51088.1 hypothetical protein [Nitrosopumilaceae archaeon]NDB87900.1 hypothetical protein [Nitrososphaerota archaeon]NDB46185.1 hypothetical protein [Nitrososphaeria archaeon]NDB62648.1 hypothetical protein [Nitrosopumilaceae archaeon]
MDGKNNQSHKKEQVIFSPQQKVQNKMSTNETTKDVFSVYTKSFDKLKTSLDKSAAQTLQSYTTLSQELITSWTNFVHTSATIQQSVANKIGINYSLPEQTVTAVSDATEAFVKAVETNNKVVQTAFDATIQNVKTVNQNASAFVELGQNVINSWISSWKPRN